ncbi:MAG TPA: 50S ribosomal protein L15 [Actinomycetes bacterium]|jgi:large subunit ribosomal protein L15|nr:50S ribosomal protein L15 [Actinomycetes bacterium]
MKLHHLRPAPGAVKDRTRKGRGEAAGKGKTAGRGTKGSKARGRIRTGFEGGQLPLQRRVPKLKGFTNPNKVHWSVVNVDRLAAAFPKGGGVDPDALVEAGLARKGTPVKVLGHGDLSVAVQVRAHAFSSTAAEKITAAGGTVEVV